MKAQPSIFPKIVVICGPTATGKSDLAVRLARSFNGEIVSADSRQVYRGLDVGAGKITKTEMKGVPHHLLDVADPKKNRYTVEDFKRDGEQAIADTLSRGKLPIICGGTGFYIDTLVHGIEFPAVPANKILRARLAKKSCEALMKELAKLDPRRARGMDPYNKVRIIRAVEIARELGKVPHTKQSKRYETLWIGLDLDRETLRDKIRARLMKRMKGGAIVREVRRLRESGVSWKRFHEFGLEYRYLALYLQKKISKEEMLSRLEIEIVQFAKRQMTWFKRNKEIEWFSPKEAGKIKKRAAKFLSPKRRT